MPFEQTEALKNTYEIFLGKYSVLDDNYFGTYCFIVYGNVTLCTHVLGEIPDAIK